MNVPVLSLSLFLNALILFLLFLYFRRKRNEQLAEILQWLMFAATWWSFFYGMEFIVNNERLIHPLLALEFSAVLSLPVLWLIVAARLSGYRFLSPRNIGWLFVVPTLNWLLLLTNPLHSLFYTDAVVTSTDGISQNFISYKPGPMFLFSHFLYSSLALAAGVVMLIRMIVFSKGISRTKALLILLATTLPYGLTLAWILGYRPFGFLDLTPYGFTIFGLTLAAVYNHVSAYELRPMVLESLFEHLNTGVIVIDRKSQTIVYSNPQGLHVFDALSERVGPKQVRGYLSSLTDFTTLRLRNEYYQVRIRELAEEDVGKALKLVSFNDVSEIKQHQANLAALTKITTTFGNDGSANIQKMLALLGEVFGAHTCLYIKKIESFFITAALWCEQPVDQGDQQVKIADGTIYNELLMLNKAEPFVVNSLQQTKYSETDPKVRLHGLNTLLGSVVEIDSKPEAAICMYFVQDRSFSDTDFQFLKLVSFVLSNEEARLKQLQKLNQAEVNLRAILENSLDSIWAVDENFCITYVNDTFKTAFRNAFNVELKIGTKIIETLPKPLQSVWLSRYEKALQGEHFVFLTVFP